MKVKDLNSSSAKTKRLIRNTFAELLYEKRNIHKITVTELVKRANINRSTFYSHYNDVWQVAEDIKHETMQAFFENKSIECLKDIERFFDDIHEYIKNNDDFFRLIFNSDEVMGFVRRLGNICKDKIFLCLKNDKTINDKSLLELEVSTVCDGLAMQFIRYYHGDFPITLNDIIEYGKRWSNDVIKRRSFM